MPLDNPHGFSTTPKASVKELHPGAKKYKSQENWPLMYRKCGLDESLPIQASVSSLVQRANTYLRETVEGIRWDNVYARAP